MKRQVLTDGTARWFDLETSTRFEERTQFDGRNQISLATGSQWEHETLYRTAGGLYVIAHTSQWQGSTDTWNTVSPLEAAAWLSINRYSSEDAETAGLGEQDQCLELK